MVRCTDTSSTNVALVPARRLFAVARRHCWELALIALFLSIAACQENPVDPGTATVTRRPKDTLLSIDTSVIHDTTVHVDTVITQNRDTLIQNDTLITVKTVIRTVQVVVRDTVIRNDTTKVHDTTRVVDTLRLLGETLPRSGVLYRKSADRGTVVAQVSIEIDDLTRIIVELKPNVGPVALQIKMIARVPTLTDTAVWGIPPSWLYLIVPRIEINNGVGSRDLIADPWNNTAKAGLAILPRYPYNRQWQATSPSLPGQFGVTRVDTVNREINAYVRAKFNDPASTVDSLVLKFKY